MNPFRLTQLGQKSAALVPFFHSSLQSNAKLIRRQFGSVEHYLKRELTKKTFSEAKLGELTANDIANMLSDPDGVEFKGAFLLQNNNETANKMGKTQN